MLFVICVEKVWNWILLTKTNARRFILDFGSSSCRKLHLQMKSSCLKDLKKPFSERKPCARFICPFINSEYKCWVPKLKFSGIFWQDRNIFQTFLTTDTDTESYWICYRWRHHFKWLTAIWSESGVCPCFARANERLGFIVCGSCEAPTHVASFDHMFCWNYCIYLH